MTFFIGIFSIQYLMYIVFINHDEDCKIKEQFQFAFVKKNVKTYLCLCIDATFCLGECDLDLGKQTIEIVLIHYVSYFNFFVA